MKNAILFETEPAISQELASAPRFSWDDITPHEHFVQFYEEDSSLLSSVSEFLANGFAKGESGIVIATKEHREGLRALFERKGIEIDGGADAPRLIMLDAAETLAQFMVNGIPDAALFEESVGALVSEIAGLRTGIRAFGEMVAVLCDDGNSKGAILLEELWNALGKKHRFALFCAYPISQFGGETDGEPFAHICKSHSRVIPAESYSRAGQTVDERLRMITQLQRKAAALEAEIAIRKRCEESLAKREADLRDFLENATEGIHQVNSEGKIVWANAAELELLGYKPDEYIGHAIQEFHADGDVIADILSRLKRGEKLHDFEARLRHKEGSIKYVAINSSGRWNGEEFLYTRCFTRDITERKKASELLEQTVAERTAELHETIAELEAFSYSISHDMRSPLRAMQAYAASILEDYRKKSLDAEGEDRLVRIQHAAVRMDLLIRDVLAYSKVAKGEVQLKPVNLQNLVRDIVEQQFGTVSVGRIENETSHTVLAHEAYLTQCLSNLIDNAVKFVAPGTEPMIRVKSELKDGLIRVSVVDNGIGIKPCERDRIFKIFGRVHSDKQYPGTGIGLAIVQKAIFRMEGEVGYDSEPGRGSTFWFSLRSPGDES
jgi:PAS domain S-box-containing protein